MKHRSILGTCIAAALGASLHANSASSQQPSLKEQLVGTWMVISWEQKKNDGTTLRQFGANPTGMAIF
ncbi:MAG: lipocalin-like domain-containing protein, partial [Bradyrhizobium sp.]|uniref:lipocalin-like domain-containing protein n=1 Tax=Bradyrhizobium sp. TaxID=376 RepID=UPI001D584348